MAMTSTTYYWVECGYYLPAISEFPSARARQCIETFGSPEFVNGGLFESRHEVTKKATAAGWGESGEEWFCPRHLAEIRADDQCQHKHTRPATVDNPTPLCVSCGELVPRL